jgi:AbrB family looped-hinge helix DNA binding protein
MNFTSTVTQKGQATIPVYIRQLLGIQPNTKIVFVVKNKKVTIKPVVDFFDLKGSIKTEKPFKIEAMDKAIKDAVIINYGKKRN